MDEFLRRVLPSEGAFTLMTIDSRLPQGDKSRVKHVNGIQTVEAMSRIVQRLSQEPLDIYFAVGSYAGKNRSEPIAKRCLFLDLDAKDFGNKQQAIADMTRFIRVSGIVPPSILVDSGRGIHVYWALDSDVPVVQWKELATALKGLCIACEFKADPAVTSDAMRVLRVPSTLNHKGDQPVPCSVLKDWGTSYTVEQIVACLAPKKSEAVSILAGTVGDDLGGAARTDYPQIPYFTAEIIEKCGVFKEAITTGGKDHTEPLWSNILSTAAFTEDAEFFIEPLSAGHPGYDKKKTEDKFAYKLSKKADGSLKPVLCTTFANYRPTICDACPFNGRIKTPLVLGKREEMAHLPPWIKITDKGVFRKTGKADSGGEDEWKMIFPYHIGNVELIDGGIGELRMRATFTSKSNVIRTEIPTTLLAKDGSALGELLVSERVLVGSNATNELKGFMMSWLKAMQDIKRNSVNRLTGMGWGERGASTVFVAGQKIFMPDGTEDHFSHMETSLLNDYTPRGKKELWEKCATTLVSDGRQAAIGTLMSSFAAPLMQLTGTGGLTFSIFSAASGTGKSSLLKTAQAVWGHPVRGVNALDDTMLSLTKKLGFLNSIPAFWDELRGDHRTIHNFAKIIFQLSQGKEKSRLNSSVKLQEMGTWKTLITMASNERINDHMDQIAGNTNAGRMRVFEVTMPPIRTGDGNRMDNAFTREIASLDNNFGHAGQLYAKHLATNLDKTRELVKTTQDQVVADLEAIAEERFWIGFVAAELVASQLVNDMGLLKFDIEPFKKWLYAEFYAQRAGSKNLFESPEVNARKLLFQFIDASREGMIVVDHIPKRGPNSVANTIIMQPKDREITVLKAMKDKRIRIKINTFRSWLYEELGYAPTQIINELLNEKGIYRVRGSVTAGVANASNIQVDCMEINLETETFASMLED